jgi:hypothetical protein
MAGVAPDGIVPEAVAPEAVAPAAQGSEVVCAGIGMV